MIVLSLSYHFFLGVHSSQHLKLSVADVFFFSVIERRLQANKPANPDAGLPSCFHLFDDRPGANTGWLSVPWTHYPQLYIIR